MTNNAETPAAGRIEKPVGVKLYGKTAKARRASAQLLVTAAERRGQTPNPWYVEVAAGRIPA